MEPSFYFFDLETSGIRAREGRVMQFGGQRTGMDLEPVGEPDNLLIKLTDDILPEPGAILVTGITPQATQQEGLTEAEFLRYFAGHIALPNTVFVGFNTVRFDHEFMRFMMYRNFYDAYEWEWKDGRSRWDILDLTRMVRALRPDDIAWPVDAEGKPTNRLELLTAANELEHDGAHDALSDVRATVALARLLRSKQPKLFDYLLKVRTKSEVAALVNAGKPFIYTSGKYPSAYEKTTIVTTLGAHPSGQAAVMVYDLRTDPTPLLHLSPAELAAAMQERHEDETKRFPVKTLKFNRCPAIAPLGVLDDASITRLKLDMTAVKRNAAILEKAAGFYENLARAINLLEQERQTVQSQEKTEVDEQLYDGFFGDGDRTKMAVVRAADASDISGLDLEFDDARLTGLLPLYKARNFPSSLSGEERENWDKYRENRLLGGGSESRAARYFKELSELSTQADLAPGKRFLLEELQLYGESILPAPD